MLDNYLRVYTDPPLRRLGEIVARYDVSANNITWLGFALGCLAALSIIFEYYYTALFFILVSRLFDGLDGAVARASGTSNEGTDYGGFLDIVLDFAFYGMIPIAFVFADPMNNALAGSFLVLTFYINGASFLAYAIMAERRGLSDDDSQSANLSSPPLPKKSFFWSVGFAEASETLAFFGIACLFSDWFPILAYIFGILVIITTASRFATARRALGGFE